MPADASAICGCDLTISTSPRGKAVAPKLALSPKKEEELSYETILDEEFYAAEAIPLWAQPWFPEEGTIYEKIYLCFEDPGCCKVSFAISMFVFILIVISSMSFIMQTDRKYKLPNSTPKSFARIEEISMTLFGLEYLFRFLAVPFCSYEILGMSPIEYNCLTFCCKHTRFLDPMRKLGNWFTRLMNFVDFLAIMPFYLTLIISGPAGRFGFLRILRLARVFRVFKVGKYSEGISLYASVFSASSSALVLLFFFSMLNSIVFGSIVYILEKGVWSEEDQMYMRPDLTGQGQEESPFTSMPQGFWWVFTTTTTVGYGDVYPTSTLGKCLAVLCMFIGIVSFAMPITIIGSNFSKMYDIRQRMIEQEKEEAEMDMSAFDKHCRALLDSARCMKSLKREIDTSVREMERFVDMLKLKRPEAFREILRRSVRFSRKSMRGRKSTVPERRRSSGEVRIRPAASAN